MRAVNHLLVDFGNRIGVEGLTLDHDAMASVQFDAVVVNMEFVEPEKTLYLYSKVEEIPEDEQGKMSAFYFLLERNCIFRGTNGGVAGIEPALNCVIFANRYNVEELDAQLFTAAVARHVDAVEDLRRGLQGRAEHLPEAIPLSNGMPGLAMLRI